MQEKVAPCAMASSWLRVNERDLAYCIFARTAGTLVVPPTSSWRGGGD